MHASHELLARWLAECEHTGHFMKAAMFDRQLAALEKTLPHEASMVDRTGFRTAPRCNRSRHLPRNFHFAEQPLIAQHPHIPTSPCQP